MDETARSHRGLWSGLAQSDQARPPDFIALVDEAPEVEIAEPDRPIAVITPGQRDRLFPPRLGQVEFAVPPLDVAIAADPADLVVGRVFSHRDLFWIATR
jgi:antitoxin (DNA-binding transcriptional repressor) of toxin-antitoxin stability system